jgi:hypothetical protein
MRSASNLYLNSNGQTKALTSDTKELACRMQMQVK